MIDIPKLKYFPEEGLASKDIDYGSLMKVYYTGLYQRTVQMDDGSLRSYKVYVPENARYDDDAIYLAVPDGVDTVAFLLESGWIDIADRAENPINLYVFEPENGCWGSAEQELPYIRKAYFDMYSAREGLRKYVYTNDFNWRWVGYGKGGEMLQRHIMENPMTAAALAVVNGSAGIEQAFLDASGRICFQNSAGHTYEEWPNSRIPVPVWLLGEENPAVIDYWKTANECTGEVLLLKDGYRFDQNPQSSNLMTFDQKVGRVVVTPKCARDTDREQTEKIFAFLMSFARCGTNSPYGNMLYPAVPDSRFTHFVKTVDGMQREWFVNVPASYTGETPMPVVFYFHGTGQGGLVGMRQGGWWQLGEKKGFITVCASGSLEQRGKGHVPIVIWNIGNPMFAGRSWVNATHSAMEEHFVRIMLEELSREYNIDKTRLYITGQSNGGRMTHMMSERGRELFAASVAYGATAKTAHTSLPEMSVGGEYDMGSARILPDGTIENAEVRDSLKAALVYRGLRLEDGAMFDNGIFRNLVWFDENKVPVFRFCCISGQAHSWRQSAVEMFWNEWMCRYSRDENTGKVLYMGK